MARVRSKDTDSEIRLRKVLWQKGLRYRVRFKLPGTPDIAFVKKRVAVFVDGCFWHGCPVHYRAPMSNAEFWTEKLRINVNRDRLADSRLNEMGWAVVRVWAHEVNDDISQVIQRITKAVTATTDN